MVIFNEIINEIKNNKSYLANGAKLTKKMMAEIISTNFDEAVESLETKELSKAIMFDAKASQVIDYISDSDIRAVFNLQYYYDKELPFSFKGYLFANLERLGEAYFNDSLDADEMAIVLKNHLVTDYLEIKGIDDITIRNMELIKLAENLVNSDKVAAASLLAYVIGNKKTYSYDNLEFNSVEELYGYVSDSCDFRDFANSFSEDKYLMGWLYYQGKKELIEKYNELVKHFDKNIVKHVLTQTVDISDVKIKEEYLEIKEVKEEKKEELGVIKEVESSDESIEEEKSTIDLWLESNKVSERAKDFIKNMSEDAKIDAFNKDLDFGTAGLRGVLSPGTNKMNIFTIRKAALAYAKYCLKYVSNAKEKGIAIAYDNRHMSKEFANEAANIFISLDIKTYLFPHIAPTPELSFAIRELKLAGGVVVTASHNPKQYNGFKVYNAKGAQLTPSEVANLKPFYNEIKNPLEIEYDIKGKTNLLNVLKDDIDKDYYEAALNTCLRKDLDPSNLTFIYTSEHGTGYYGVRYAMKKLKYNYIEVKEQCKEDSDFSETLSANPEDRKAYDAAIRLAKLHKETDLIIATDPDADRLGVVCFKKKKPYYLSGNQVGALLINYLILTHKELNSLKPNSYVFDTIVTSPLGAKIAKANKLKVKSSLTGFKYIAENIDNLKADENLFFAYEESYGYLIKETTRDKDALQSLLLVLEMANYYKTKDLTLVDVLDSIYEEYGYHLEETKSIYFNGSNGSEKINEFMKVFRDNPPSKLGGIEVEKIYDYNSNLNKQLPKSDVLRYVLANGSEICIRPSGTEPKCKLYFNLVANNEFRAKNLLSAVHKDIDKIINKL